MKLDKFICNLLLFLILAYNAQGYFYDSGSLLSRSILLIWLLISLGYALRFIFYKETDKIGKILFIFWILNAIYWLLSPKILYSELLGTVLTTNMFKNITISILTYFPFFYFIKNGILKSTKFRLFVVLLFILSLLQYVLNYSIMQSKIGNEDIVNNASYAFVFLFPFCCLFLNRKFFFYVLYCISLILIIMGNKRGVILTFSVQSLLMIFFILKKSGSQRNVLKWLLTILSLAVIAYIGYKAYIQNDYLSYRIELAREGNSSERNIIYSLLWNKCLTGNPFNLLFGYGFAQSVSLAGITAHNDWLEILSGQGLMGLVIFIALFYVIIKNYLRNRKLMDNNLKLMYLSSLIAMLFTSSFSAGYNSLTYYLLLVPIFYVNHKTYKR